jgi:hypothetical protein
MALPEEPMGDLLCENQRDFRRQASGGSGRPRRLIGDDMGRTGCVAIPYSEWQ